MILSTLAESGRIESLHPAFKQVFDYVKSHDLTTVAAGRIVLDGDRVFINVDDAALRTEAEQALEVHRRYIDIHFPLSGSERVGWSPLANLVEDKGRAPFDVERDFALYDQHADTYFDVVPGQFYVMYPEDAHAPIIGCGTLRKLVAKVRID